MANKGSPKHEKMQKNLCTQLAVAVRSIQWSYGIFWAPSTTEERVLEWREGYYNGDIKTRKTVQAMELEMKADKIGLQRSEQLKELYKFLLAGEADPQTKRPSAALAPEDLSDLEWYYLVCMSFVFGHNQSSLPGKALEIGDTIWLCDAQHADSKIFSRSLLAKTVVCFPYQKGVIEIGSTELVIEDPNLIQHVKACFLEISKPTCSDKSSSVLDKPHDDKYPTCTKGDHRVFDAMALANPCSLDKKIKFDNHDPVNGLEGDNNEDSNMDFPDGCEHHYPMESMIDGMHGVPSQVHFVNDALVIGAPDSLSSCDCMSEASENQGKDSKNEGQTQLLELQDCYKPKRGFLDAGADEDLCYIRTLCAILGNSSTFKANPYAGNSNCKSSFAKWKKGRVSERKRSKFHQSMLKKTLFKVPFMHRSYFSRKSQKESDRMEWTSKLENAGDDFIGKALTDKKREVKNFQVLKSFAPSSISEEEKISILGDTIKYLKRLETRVEELESYMEVADAEARTRRKCPDVLEQMSDNYGTRKICMGVKPWMNKRKASGFDEMDTELERLVCEEAKALDVKVKVKEQEVLIEMKCPYREYILYDIMDTINNLHLDAHTVESSTSDGVLSLTLKSKFRGAATAPLRMIKEALWKAYGNV
ncbi:Transcription factor GLABRA 3 Basic helix-loop-helix protein [Vigna angularis]|uniref:Transcription factor GLABRA 3 Basic helix-loop-helix protein n=1 Tax=Phaseolus angularis TaxID=3914 RepID=A0A8T0JQ62_PHAAN|nr:Transcription factor GLABRA 3 Basic helix-loop-helix protein [Vigna angularis]